MKIYDNKKHNFFLILILTLFLISCQNKKNESVFYYPADFDTIESTSFVWTNEYFEIVPKLVGIISAKDMVTLYYDGTATDSATIYKILKSYESNIHNIKLIEVKNKPKSNWIRDFGPVYLISNSGKSMIIDFEYFGKRLNFNSEIAAKYKIPVNHSTINSSGGSRETNGKGTLIVCEAHELDVNKPKTRIEIEKEYKDKLAIDNVIWLKRGIPQDDSRLNGPLFEQIYPNGVNGHVDQFCRFADANTVLISSVSDEEAKLHPILAEAKKRMDENFQILLNSTDQDGKKFKIIKVPFAPLLFMKKTHGTNSIFVTPVTSYMNFIVTNSLIILPSYISSQPDNISLQNKEIEIEEIFRKAFPTRRIIKVQASDLNSFSGGFHCISINNPFKIK